MDISFNCIISEKVKVCQPDKGFRFSVDSIYLAWFVRHKKDSCLIDIGSGSGVIAALLAILRDFRKVCALEMQPKMFRCLEKTVEASGISEAVTPIMADIREYRPESRFDIAVCNPPYRNPSAGRIPAGETELNARFTTTMNAGDVFKFCKSYLNNSGSLYLSYDADMMPDLFEAGAKYGFEAKRLMPVCPDIGIKPKIILMEFRRSTGREMIFEAPLYQKINGQQSEMDKKIMTGQWFE